MKGESKKFKTVDEYIAGFPPKVKARLRSMRKAIKEAAPGAEENISYNMPVYKLNGILVYYAAYKEHIGFYPMPSAIEAFRKKLEGYELSKGTVRLPHDEPLPLELIGDMVRFRVRRNLLQAEMKAKK